jgi:hypothetical protein
MCYMLNMILYLIATPRLPLEKPLFILAQELFYLLYHSGSNSGLRNLTAGPFILTDLYPHGTLLRESSFPDLLHFPESSKLTNRQ